MSLAVSRYQMPRKFSGLFNWARAKRPAHVLDNAGASDLPPLSDEHTHELVHHYW